MEIWCLEHLKDLLIVCIKEIIFLKKIHLLLAGISKVFLYKEPDSKYCWLCDSLLGLLNCTAIPLQHLEKKKRSQRQHINNENGCDFSQ